MIFKLENYKIDDKDINFFDNFSCKNTFIISKCGQKLSIKKPTDYYY